MEKKSQDEQFTQKIGASQLNKLKNPMLPPLLNTSLSRMYFSSFFDIFNRFSILSVQIVWIVVIFFNGVSLSRIVIDHLDDLNGFTSVQQGLFKLFALLITIFFASGILIMIIPLFLVKTIKSVSSLCVFYLIFGSFINFLLIVLSYFTYYYSITNYSLFILILAITSLFSWWKLLFNWFLQARKKRTKIIKSIIKTYELTFK